MKKNMNLKYITILGFMLQFSLLSPVSALTVDAVVRHTLDTNPDVQSARKEYLARESEIRGAKAGYLPRLDASAGIGREVTDSPSTNNDRVALTRREASVQLRQMLFDGMATSSEVRRQEARYNSALYEAIAVEENISLRAIETYLDVMRHKELRDLVGASLKTHQEIYDQMSLRSKAGVGSKADLDQIAARLALANSNFIAGENNLLDAKTNFTRVVGYDADETTLEEPRATVHELLPSSLEVATEKAYQNHPTLLAASADVDDASAQYDASESPFWPTIQLEGERTWNEDIDGVRGDNEDGLIALRLRYNLYNGGANKARRKQTAVLVEEAKDIRNSTKRQVAESLRLSWNAAEATKMQLESLSRYVHSVSDTKEAYAKQFNIGRRTLLDLLNTENELIDARRSFINAKYDWIFAQYRVFNAMGGLNQSLAIK